MDKSNLFVAQERRKEDLTVLTKYFKLLKETKTCVRLECREDNGSFTTMYLKKDELKAAGIDPAKGVTIHIEQTKEDSTHA